MRTSIVVSQDAQELTRRALRAASRTLLVAGIIALSYAGYAVMDRYWFESPETAKSETVRAPAELLPVEPIPIIEGGVIGEIEVPRLGLKPIVVQGDSEKLLRRAVGHLSETALPRETGNVALAAHRDGLFRTLRNTLPGDTITLKTPDREFQDQVEWTAVVPPTVVRVLQPTVEPALTLVTCFPFYCIGAAPERFIVRARKIAIEATPPVP
jgi:LPXTG-site transpeptidase (sortase) family protein